ncbi:TonB-dependent receptor [Aquirufa rosea]|uniref:TonB-dependent receptor n=1 Tax=Aquirufa rosea TaxID=2509241 RepID=A0A4Q1C1S0_9BACT|nr:TonB-dependent receptor [Aquirufa rosea]RXK50990.1 TonB-dependent receptor [Aquirufa rosea]
MKKVTTSFILLLVCVLVALSAKAQKSYRWEGIVQDQENSQALWGASIQLQDRPQGTLTDSKGHFVLTSNQSFVVIQVRFLGYETESLVLDAKQKSPIIRLKKSSFMYDEVVVKSTRADGNSAMAFSNVGAKELAKSNLGQDMPVLLNFTPSIVTTSDAGAGIGYTGIRIRGTDATRVNVTINGIPVNDSESQGTYWVNMPDFASSVASVQIQRGVGTSTNGAGAFGGSVNMQTNTFEKDAYAEINASGGSFGTLKTTLKLGTGLMAGKWILDGRLSRVVSDGYIDRSFSNLQSAYVSGAYFGKKSFYRVNYFTGKEKTFQSWYGTPESRVNNDLEGMKAYIERNWLSDAEAKNLLESGRTYNYYTYPNQTDNYAQDHYQLLTHHSLGTHWDLDLNGHYTYGRGYYEEYKADASLSKYGLAPINLGSVSLTSTNLVRRKWLDNDFYGSTFALNFDANQGFKFTFGGAWNRYIGRHFGEVISGENLPSSYLGHRWYQSRSQKTDFNMYVKMNYALAAKWQSYLDLQYRTVGYKMQGTADKMQDIGQTWTYHFFNPKFGLTHQLGESSKIYASVSVGSKEPSRQDFIDNPGTTPRSEFLTDYELGFERSATSYSFQLNAYRMQYRDQLVLTGAVNSVGEAIRTNVPESYRMGIEASLNYRLSNHFTWQANATLSQNKVLNFVESIPDYDTGGVKSVNHGNSDIAYSPSTIAGSQLTYSWKGLETTLLTKYVGQQYLDNTSSENRKLKAYWTQDIRFIYPIKTSWAKQLQASLLLNNVANSLYSSNGYTYSYVYDQQVITENFHYPQAGFNFLLGLFIRL